MILRERGQRAVSEMRHGEQDHDDASSCEKDKRKERKAFLSTQIQVVPTPIVN